MKNHTVEQRFGMLSELQLVQSARSSYLYYRIIDYDPKAGTLHLAGSYNVIALNSDYLVDYQVFNSGRSFARRYRHIGTELLEAEVGIVRDGWHYSYQADFYSAEERERYRSWQQDKADRQRRREGRKIITIGSNSRLSKYLEDPEVTELHIQIQDKLYLIDKKPDDGLFDWEDLSVLEKPDPPSDKDKIGLRLCLAPVTNRRYPFKNGNNLYYGTIAGAYMNEEGLSNIGVITGSLEEITRKTKRNMRLGDNARILQEPGVTFLTYNYKHGGPLRYRRHTNKPSQEAYPNDLVINPGQVVPNMGFGHQFLVDDEQASLVVSKLLSNQIIHEFYVPFTASLQEFKQLVESDDWLKVGEKFPFGIKEG